ncbi:MAG TPA: hypothetical protein VMA73_02545, partial [Streptosporangiaceae bacterium]|nr:hypothetical protein [Streptosporangiaceae bacterium]
LMHAGLYLLAAIGCAALLPIDTRPGNEYVAVFPLAVTAGILALFPAGIGLSRFGYDIMTRTGLSPFELFLSVALVGAAACVLLLPIILGWRTIGYFDTPAARRAGPPGAWHSGGEGRPGGLSAPPARSPSDYGHDGGGGREQGGATALPPRSQADSRRHGR